MKVLQINYSDYANGGGGAIAMYRLYQSLKNIGIDGNILSNYKTLSSDESQSIDRSQRWESQIRKITSRLGLNDLHCISSFGVKKNNFYIDADVLNFHILHSGFFNYLAIPSLTKNKPAVFTLHDMWSFTGHCAYSYDCDRWKTGCGQCPQLDTYPAVARDNTKWEWKLKNWVYNRSNLVIVTPSKWLTEQAKQSMLDCLPIHHIPYGLDTEAYQPIEAEHCKYALGIPHDKKVLMFCAVNLKDRRKGGDLLNASLQKLPASLKKDIVLLTLGNSGEHIESIGIDTINLGYVSSDRLKSIAYSAADLFIFPTRADNLPLVLQESMACGTPMVSFKIGGVPDLVRHNITGYLAAPEDFSDFSQGIIQLLEDNQLRTKMKQNCREIAINEYSLELQAQRYVEIYQRLLETQQNNINTTEIAEKLTTTST
ncbi:glycosyltransferase family 4 protein [Pleurocapsa sp. FMAR1]|uniref:glycosyltransferase family 4 protein n=1 Tax=Pleurocapsa sp. FMAR1 TaxID=3040204 RepID=UPI0029C90A34|nr:glycosyltransferase family 4 protein [Pleurocapsa sp. FMAR1]